MCESGTKKAPFIAIDRCRMGTDGTGVTTLVAFYGCPLRCKYCLNPHCFAMPPRVMLRTPEEVMSILRKDELYFLVTHGGATFGGGEPMLYSKFIVDLMELGAKEWNTTVETSLNCRREHVERLLPYVDSYIVDIKDMNPIIYEAYTGKSNDMVIDNLRYLVEQGKADRILCRIPLIEGYNTTEHQENSKRQLSSLGIKRFYLFTYLTNND